VASNGYHGLTDRVANTHRPFRLARQRNHQRFEFGVRFAAVTAAQIIDDHPHFCRPHVKQFGNIAANLKRMLRRRPDGNFIVVVLRDHGMRLHSIVIDHRERKRVLDDHVRQGKAFIDIAPFNFFMRADIASLLLVNQRRVFLDRCVNSSHRGQFFVVHVDQ
jgi:hypothetical protein